MALSHNWYWSRIRTRTIKANYTSDQNQHRIQQFEGRRGDSFTCSIGQGLPLLTTGLANLRITNKTEPELEHELASQKHGSGSNETKMPQQRTWTDMNQQSHYKEHISMSHRKKLNNGHIDQIKFIFFISICDKLKGKNTILNNGHRYANSANI
jgi:hypothetical protein